MRIRSVLFGLLFAFHLGSYPSPTYYLDFYNQYFLEQKGHLASSGITYAQSNYTGQVWGTQIIPSATAL